MSVPVSVDDGNFKVALQDGAPEYSFPFADKGDGQTFIAHVKKRQWERYYRRPQLMYKAAFVLGSAYRVDFGEPRSIGNGLLEWIEKYASLPANRDEYGSTVYSQQFIFIDNSTLPASYSIDEFTSVRDARFLSEYSLNKPLPRKLAPRFVTLGGRIYGIGGIHTVPANAEFLAEDTSSEIYLARIYCRKSAFVTISAATLFA